LHKALIIFLLVLATASLVLSGCGCEQNEVNPTPKEGPDIAWMARYDGGLADDDGGQAIALDESGNLYVTGYSWGNNSSSDFATMKYDNLGNRQWIARYNGPANEEDWALDMAMYNSDYLYVAGWSSGNGTRQDYTVIKYDSDGNQVWESRYNGPVSGCDLAYSIAVDYSGNSYVTGWSQGNGTQADYMTIRYNSDGKQLWAARYNGQVSGEDKGYDIAVDGWANVHVTGWSQGNGTGTDFTTIKYDLEGNQLWVARYDGPVSLDDSAQAVAVDGWGNVYELWAARYDGPANGEDKASAMIVDRWGNVFIAGNSEGNGTQADYIAMKHSDSGRQQWVARYDRPSGGEDISRAIGLDGWDNIYVSGWSEGDGARYDFVTVKYDSGGNEQWATRYDGPANGHDKVYAMTIDGLGNAYVTGRSSGNTTYYDYTTIKYVQ